MRHWTAAERAKQSALIQTWKPWAKSTGAKTELGKAASSQNAYKGGHRAMMREISAVLKEQREGLKLIQRG